MVSLVSSSDFTRMRFDRGLLARLDLAAERPEIGFSIGKNPVARLRGGLATRVAKLLHLGAETIVEAMNTRESLAKAGIPPDDMDFATVRALLARVEEDRRPHPDWSDQENEWAEWIRSHMIEGISETLPLLSENAEERSDLLKSFALTLASFSASKAGGIPIHDGISWLEWAFGVEDSVELLRDAASEPGATSWESYVRLYPNIPAIGATFIETPAADLAGMAASDRKYLKVLDHEGRPQDTEDFDPSTAVECDFASLSLVVPMASTHPDAALMMGVDDGIFGVVLPQIVDMAEIERLQNQEEQLAATHFFPLHPRFLPSAGKSRRIIQTA